MAKRPNVLFLYTDDQRYDSVRALGNEVVHTPTLDALAGRGVTFTRPYIMGSTVGAVCICSRATLMTGRTLWHAPRDCPEALPILPEVLREAGYTTFGTGKWHNQPGSYARGFSQGSTIFFGGMSNHLAVPIHDFHPNGEYRREDQRIGKKFSSELFTDAAVDFLHRYEGEAPFFAYVSYTAPHDPRMAPERYEALYPRREIPVPENFVPEHPFDNGEMRIRDEELAPWPRTQTIVREHIGAYYAMITHLDEQMGRVLAALDARGDRENTIVVFAGDNGLAVGQHGLLGKQNLYEHSLRVPLLMAGPGIARGESRDAFCYHLDLFPTLCELAGVAAPGTVEGASLAPVLRGEATGVRDTVFAAYRDCQRMVRTDRFKLIRYTPDGPPRTQLFDLAEDPWETNDVAGDTAYSEHVAELESRLREWQEATDDPLVGGGAC